uniref:Uncharacterized protein n=1 Tax=Arundo donax TaxID=35708 RepID=A0A0A9ABE2_ARUDO
MCALHYFEVHVQVLLILLCWQLGPQFHVKFGMPKYGL